MSSLIPSLRSPEFPAGASDAPSEMDRREFLRLAGATLSLAGLAGAGCERPAKTLVPYVSAPDGLVPGIKQFYATAMAWQGFARGILVESHEGRPTKIEGNPRHRESGGATDAVTQASVRSLYDPDRSTAPRLRGEASAWDAFEAEWRGRRERLERAHGEGWALVTEPTTSPTLRREIGRLLAKFPRARWYQHSALPRYDRDGRQADLAIATADVILAVEADFLGQHPAAVRYGREFAARRRLRGGEEKLNRLYAIEAGRTITGSMADVRLPLRPSRLALVLAAIASGEESGLAAGKEIDFVRKVREDLRAAGPAALCVAGPEQGSETHRWVAEMNLRLGGEEKTVSYRPAVRSDGDAAAGSSPELIAALHEGKITTLCCLGVNPVYASAAGAAWSEAIARAEFSLHVGEYADETAAVCRWHLPESHYLETWGDLRGFDGSGVIQQPLIEPLHDTRSLIEVVRLLADGEGVAGYELVRATHAVDDEIWRKWLNAGVAELAGVSRHGTADGLEAERVVPNASSDADRGPTSSALGTTRSSTPAGSDELELVIRPDGFLWDGRFANNAWLQELPKPFTSLVWDNALAVSPDFAKREGLVTGDILRLTPVEAAARRFSTPESGEPRLPPPNASQPAMAAGEGRENLQTSGQAGMAERHSSGGLLEMAIVVVPGIADGCGIAELGGGRTMGGTAGTGRGFNAHLLRGGDGPSEQWTTRARWAKTGKTFPLVSTQHHFTMEGRDLVHVVQLADLATAAGAEETHDSLYPARPAPTRAWGMVIDLSSCLGCSACVIACQAENNIPSVGKDAVSRGREMHWIRLDRYYGPDDRALVQPVPCMQCENAPCEAVCPVGATVHSTEGVNEMVYNRCVGTRYCSNNCPYKVRRFNFFDFKSPPNSPLHLQENPAVTVRDRGVMEKCSYCVQRIDAGRIAAERENRPLRDGEIRTACQQACPAEAIVFGDLADAASAVSLRKRQKTHYSLLGELNTRPRTTYLAKVLNPG